MKENRLKICPICHKPFDTTSKQKTAFRVTCSTECLDKMASIVLQDGKEAANALIKEADELCRRPNKTCIMYRPDFND